jgi:tetratricopeptide (TPR) repeat protein
MYNKALRKYLVVLLAIGWVITLLYFLPFKKKSCPLEITSGAKKITCIKKAEQSGEGSLNDAFSLLKSRNDNAALVIFDKVLIAQPDNLDALWGKAEVLRRIRDYKRSEVLLNGILKREPGHIPSLISLAYIRYKDDKLEEALQLVNLVLKNKCPDRENEALAYMMLGTINSRRTAKGWFFSKVRYGTQIKCFFLKAEELAPDLPEVHLGLGTFYLMAPAIVGGNLSKAIGELELAVRIAPGFATANARLAQGYKKKGDWEKYHFYLRRAKELDPENEVVREDEKSGS